MNQFDGTLKLIEVTTWKFFRSRQVSLPSEEV